MSNQKYRSRLEHVLTVMLTKCMRADGTIPRFLVSQLMRPYLPSSELDDLLEPTPLRPKRQPLKDNEGPGRRGSYYLASDVLEALQEEQKHLDELLEAQEQKSTKIRSRLQHFPNADDDEVEDAANGVVK